MAMIKNKQILSVDATKIVESDSKKFVSTAQTQNWDGKADKTAATGTEAGLMSAEDKAKLDTIAEGATNYVHPESHPATMITTDADHQFVTAAEKASFADKYTKNEVDNLVSQIESGIEWKDSVATYADIATTYTNPSTGWVVSVDNENGQAYRYTGTEWAAYNIGGYVKATEATDGLMSKEDKAKLDTVESGANNYVHPEFHTPSIIAQDENNRLVTDAQIASWENKADNTVATTGANGLMSSTDKAKLNSLAKTELRTITVLPAAPGATVVSTGIKTNGTGVYNTNQVGVGALAINGFVQVEGVGKDYTISENASNELVINWSNRHFSLDTDDEITISYMQLV